MESYLETVQAQLLALRGGGLTLSPVESDVIRAWRDRGVPLELALLGLEQAYREHVSAGRAPRVRPLSLARASAWVEELFESYERRSGSVAPASPRQAVAGDPLASVREALQVLAEASPGAAARAHRAALAELRSGRAPEEALFAADLAQALAYLCALPRPEQRLVASQAAREAGPRRGVPRSAHRATLRALLGEAARRAGALPRPSDLP